MNKDTRNAIERAAQRARKLLEEDFAAQLEGDFDVHRDGMVAAKAGTHLAARQAFQRERIVAAIEHKRAAGMSASAAARDYLRDAAFTTLNRFVALKMLEARDLVQECITKGEQSGGYREFCGMAPGLPLLPESAGYRLYIESLFDELSTEVKVLFDRRDPSSVLWPKRSTFEQLLAVLNATELARVWSEDETIGWVYQFFNGQDERRKMREESQAPRDSRELAVRNQFFTPRYVVQFLTDNTLGRIWYEMRDKKTELAEQCEYMVHESGKESARRARKDPRDIRLLDPACGSGHFLLYAFDLFLTIYEEAHADPESPNSEATGKTLAEEYETLDALRKALPGLVLAHNLHGVDIDARCAQIAQLALWMRAQKAYRDFGIGRNYRARIRRSNIVVAEPLIANDQIAKEFVVKLGDAELWRVLNSLVESLSLAGDLGILLRIEQLVALQAKRGQTGDLFAPPEERIRAALNRFVREEMGAMNTRRRLFADDAAHGVALLSVAEKKFDTVLMNPPFGPGTLRAKAALERSFPRTKNDIFAAFVERGVELLCDHGILGAITSRTGFFLPSFQQWREQILLSEAVPVVVADLGLGVMDAALVEAAAYCLEKGRDPRSAKTVFLRTLEALGGAKQQVLLRSVRESPEASHGVRFELEPARFAALSRSPFAYWVGDEVRRLFSVFESVESGLRTAKVGLQTSDDFRFVRLRWEVADVGRRWVLFAKGGAFSPYYADVYLVVNWHRNGHEVSSFDKAYPRNVDFLGRPGLTWPHRTKSQLGFRALPAGCAFGHKGPSVFVEGDDPDELMALLAVFRSSVFRALADLQLAAAEPTGRGGAARSYDVGVVQRTPIPPLTGNAALMLAAAARQGWRTQRGSVEATESALAFLLPYEILPHKRRRSRSQLENEIAGIESEIDQTVLRLYGIEARHLLWAERSAEGMGGAAALPDGKESDDDDENEDVVSAAQGLETTLSWLVGVSFGRFDPRLATGERAVPPEPEPFDPLPRRAPGMYPEGEEPADRPDILVDDEGHADDLAARARVVAERVTIGAPENLRAWLAKEFFPLHIKTYSKSRRKAPIYWQLATPSASYSVWLYIHAFGKDTLFRVQNDYAAPKLAHEERRLESFASELRDGATVAQRKTLAAQEAVVDELRAFLEEVKRVAPLWNPNLDDGVILNFAPLWRLVPQNKAWQKELKSTWDALCEGRYDWAHLAMHLWPERVVPKCAKDRSLAIAHGLEEVLWVEGTDGKWTARKTPTRSVDELVRERTSPAVKSALNSLLEAPAVAGKGAARRGGGRRRSAAALEGGDA